jgi:glycine/D-amino acid oxidase-like deaminating enzyme/nitrite reductase/ring-hydroxylating ferredoxin subunit
MATRSSSYAGTLPYWTEAGDRPSSTQLDRDLSVDVVVVGGGITGLTTAYFLVKEGITVAVLERATCGAIDTGHTSAHLTMVTDARLGELVQRFGRPAARAVWDAGLGAVAQIEAICVECDIDCSFERIAGYLHLPHGTPPGESVTLFQDEARLASEMGFDAVFVEAVPFVGGPGVRFGNQARMHPAKYLSGLIRAIKSRGGHVFENSEASEFSDDPLGVKVGQRTVRCKDIVIATHSPLVGIADMSRATLFQTKLALYTTYVVAGLAPRGAVPDALFWDTAEPYRYLRVDSVGDHEVVIYGGEDHKTGQVSDTNGCYERLERALQARVPGISLSHRWSGQVIETPDGLPYIGAMTEHQYVATGYAGNGLTFGTAAASIIAGAILGRQSPSMELFDPGRQAIHGLWNYIKENTDYPLYLMRDRFSEAEEQSWNSVKPGEGQIVNFRGAKVAASRDSDGRLDIRDATCPHLGCVVAWNGAERTWDCPCHGSRFTPQGAVISGPAESPLSPVKT